MLVLESEDDLAGLPDFLRAAAKQAGDRAWSSRQVRHHARALQYRTVPEIFRRRDLREKAYKAWIARGENGGASDTTAIIVAEMLRLRGGTRQAARLPEPRFPRSTTSMAKTPEGREEAADNRLDARTQPRARRARRICRRWSMAEGETSNLRRGTGVTTPRNCARRATTSMPPRSSRTCNSTISSPRRSRPRAGCSASPSAERTDIPRLSSRRARMGRQRDGRHVGVFLGDYFARPSKHSGRLDDGLPHAERNSPAISRPIIVNVMNFAKGAPGEPSLLSMDDARTLFHEFGHCAARAAVRT